MRNNKSRTGYMELNTINKTGTWSETADRINSNFSKISIEVEEIKQNGGGGSGGGGDVTNADHATSAYTLDKNTPVLDWFLSALNDDDAQGIINFLKGLKITGNLVNRIVKQGDKDVTYTDEDVMSALRVMTEIENSAEKLKEIFLRKDVADSTKFLLSMFAGAVFGKNGFASGLTGFGAKIFDTGHGEFESMFIRRFLEVPELRYNRVMVTLGDKWRAPGAGIIETVDTGTKTCTLKLEDTHFGNNQAGIPRTAIGHAHTVLSRCPRCSRITFRSNLQPIAVRSRCSRRTILIDTRPHASVIRQAVVVIVMYARYIAFLTEIQSLYRCSVRLYLLDNTCHIYIIQIHGVTIHV